MAAAATIDHCAQHVIMYQLHCPTPVFPTDYCSLTCALRTADVGVICLAVLQGFVSSSTPLKASEPAFQHQDDEGCAFQTKIFEVLDMKKDGAQKLWVSNECMVLDAVKKVMTDTYMFQFGAFTAFHCCALQPCNCCWKCLCSLIDHAWGPRIMSC
jgi:hypothetical protein